MLMFFNWLGLGITIWVVCRINNKLKKLATKINTDINTLRKNQSVLNSSVRQVYRILRKHDKNIKKPVWFPREDEKEGEKES